MELELSHFETVLHICVLLNFLYAISDEFSEKVFPLIGSPFRDKFNSQLASCSLTLTTLEDENDLPRTDIFKEAFVNLTGNVREFNKSAEKDTEISPKFRSIYLFGGLYAFLLLLHSGLSKYFTNSCDISCILFYSDIYTLLFYTYAIFLTFLPKKQRIRTLRVFGLFALLISFQLFSYLSGFKHIHSLFQWFFTPYRCMGNNNCMTLFSLVLVMLPIVLHILRSLIKLIIDYRKIKKDLNQFSNGLRIVQKSTTKTTETEKGGKMKDDIISKYNELLEEFSTNDPS